MIEKDVLLRHNLKLSLEHHVVDLGKTLHLVMPETHGFPTLSAMQKLCDSLGLDSKRFAYVRGGLPWSSGERRSMHTQYGLVVSRREVIKK